MKSKIIGVTVEKDKVDFHEAKVFSGKNAGICYQKDSNLKGVLTGEEALKELDRFNFAIGNGHHSIADHVKVEVYFENISKMLAIVLNSLQDYATSEKSGRYTIMTGNSKREQELYDKWLEIYRGLILKNEPNLDDSYLQGKLNKKYPDSGYVIKEGHLLGDNPDKEVSDWFVELLDKDITRPSIKMAQENARYVLSVFTRSTSMGYSTSIRQWNYIYDWCIKYINSVSGKDLSYFEEELLKDFKELSNFIKENLYIDGLRDFKNRCFDFLTYYSGEINHPMAEYTIGENYYGDAYTISYYASFVHIAQAQRHRVIKYFMHYMDNIHMFYTPQILFTSEDTNIVNEWLSDLKSVENLIPQATLVGIIETGHISDFVTSKCTERLCGRAQLEIMRRTVETVNDFNLHRYDFSRAGQAYLDKVIDSTGVLTKCKQLGSCKEGCRWGSEKALTRNI